jgi:hypothetical protein
MWQTLIESLLLIGGVCAPLIWYAVAEGHREDRELRQPPNRVMRDTDAHLGRTGTE